MTTWNYDTNRGWLGSKKYADNNGPSYTYTAAGKLKTRAWARTVVTTNSYNNAGQLSGISYPASTPSVAMVYNREGDNSAFTQGAITTTWSYSGNGQVLLQTALGKLRRASGHFPGRILALDPHRLVSYSRRDMIQRRPASGEKATKQAQTFFLLDAESSQPVCLTNAGSGRTLTSASQEVLQQAQKRGRRSLSALAL